MRCRAQTRRCGAGPAGSAGDGGGVLVVSGRGEGCGRQERGHSTPAVPASRRGVCARTWSVHGEYTNRNSGGRERLRRGSGAQRSGVRSSASRRVPAHASLGLAPTHRPARRGGSLPRGCKLAHRASGMTGSAASRVGSDGGVTEDLPAGALNQPLQAHFGEDPEIGSVVD